MLWDSGWEVQTKRSFLWGTPANASTMLDAEYWVLVGTFKSAPDMFYQLFTFHGIFPDNCHLPLFYGFLPGKTTLLYQNLFEELNIWGTYQPHSILIDYEIDYRLRSRMWSPPNLETIKAYTSCRTSRVCCVLWIDMDWNIHNRSIILSRYVEPAWCRPALTTPLCQHRWGLASYLSLPHVLFKTNNLEVPRLPQGQTVVNRCLAHKATPLWASRTSSRQMGEIWQELAKISSKFLWLQ